MLIWLLASCGSSRSATQSSSPATTSGSRHLNHTKGASGQQRSSGQATVKQGQSASSGLVNGRSLEWLDPLLFKYAILLNTEVEQLDNLALWQFIDRWYGTRYQYGGSTMSGVDCSGFTQQLTTAVYGVSLPRTSKEQYQSCQRIEATELREGDLVFFNTSGGVSHVGVYLRNNKFVHASTSAGVMISDLQEPYYKQRWVGAGRLAISP